MLFSAFGQLATAIQRHVAMWQELPTQGLAGQLAIGNWRRFDHIFEMAKL